MVYKKYKTFSKGEMTQSCPLIIETVNQIMKNGPSTLPEKCFLRCYGEEADIVEILNVWSVRH